MTYSPESERRKYSRELAEYTRRQFLSAQADLERHPNAVEKIPASHAAKIRALSGKQARSSGVRRSSRRGDAMENLNSAYASLKV